MTGKKGKKSHVICHWEGSTDKSDWDEYLYWPSVHCFCTSTPFVKTLQSPCLSLHFHPGINSCFQ